MQTNKQPPKHAIIQDVEAGEGTRIFDQVNLFKCKIGKNSKIDSFVYIEEDVVVGDNCKIRPFVFIPSGVVIEDNVFVGPNVTFTNDRYPRSLGMWTLVPTRVKKGASIGANSVILPGVTIGEDAMIGAGSVVTKDVPNGITVVGNPAKPIKKTLTIKPIIF
jgi:acetyltransferase-like isoleucine patch superfamily enzyme